MRYGARGSMKIAEFIKKHNCRLSCGDSWLVYNDITEMWVVYSHKLYARKSVVVIETEDEDEAVGALFKTIYTPQ